jgi:hypothetical protein
LWLEDVPISECGCGVWEAAYRGVAQGRYARRLFGGALGLGLRFGWTWDETEAGFVKKHAGIPGSAADCGITVT